MNYLVTYDKYLEEGVMLLNARMSFKNERAVTIGWLFWAFAIVKKNGMHL